MQSAYVYDQSHPSSLSTKLSDYKSRAYTIGMPLLCPTHVAHAS